VAPQEPALEDCVVKVAPCRVEEGAPALVASISTQAVNPRRAARTIGANNGLLV
jgi:hypothetical protein